MTNKLDFNYSECIKEQDNIGKQYIIIFVPMKLIKLFGVVILGLVQLC